VLLRQHGELLRCGQTSPVVAHLPFADHVHKLDATQNDLRTTEVLEALYRSRDALDRAMVLRDDVVEILALPDDDLGPVLPIIGSSGVVVGSVEVSAAAASAVEGVNRPDSPLPPPCCDHSF
jgi:hypothetical protein